MKTIYELPPREEFIEYVTTTHDEDEPGEMQFPESGFKIGFGADIDFFHRVCRAINEGIDAHLEAVAFTREGDVVTISDAGSMHTLLRRMQEHADTLPCQDVGSCDGTCGWETALREIGDMLDVLGYESNL